MTFPGRQAAWRLVQVPAFSLAIAISGAKPVWPQGSGCPGPLLDPAYAHNDYQNPRPLLDALGAGYQGVEVDLFLDRDVLVTAHDRAQVRSARRFEATYLQPLLALVTRCGRILAGFSPFLLNIELKERSKPAFDSLLAMVERYPGLFSPQMGTGPSPVELVLVGWHPAPGELRGRLPAHVHLQYKVTDRDSKPLPDSTELVRLVSLDYGKTIGWEGRGSPPASAASWLAALKRARSAGPRRIARVYNVPPDSAVYSLLLREGVDLLGINDLARGSRMLAAIREPEGSRP